MSEAKPTVSIEEERLERILQAIALASTGDFGFAMDRLQVADHDSFGMLEEAMRIFLKELADTKLQNVQAIEALAASKHDLEEQVRTIERQQIAIRELSVPIIDVWEGILTLPLIGLLDTSRAVEVTEKLLKRVADSDVDWVILDLTGVTIVDTLTAQHLIKLADAVQLLGANCVITGIGGQVAETLVTLGVSLEQLSPLRSLREGLRHCLARRARARARST